MECALKACIAKQTRRSEFPDKKKVEASYSHNLAALVPVANLQAQLKVALLDKAFKKNWESVLDWSEQSRYKKTSQAEAQELFLAITDRRYGVLPWIKKHW